MDEHIYKRHNKTLLLYHLVFPVKDWWKVIEGSISRYLKEICIEIGEGYEIQFVEIGTDDDHVHFLIQRIPIYSVIKLVTIIKSLIAREVLKQWPDVKKQLWGGEFFGKGYFVNTLGQDGTENRIS